MLNEKEYNEMIEEIASILCPIYRPNCDEYIPLTCAKCYVGGIQFKEVVDELLAKGYRKVERGEWKLEFTLDDTNFYRCSVCDRQETLLAKESTLEFFPYCHCGADMRGEDGR